ncbi:MAG TPA: hypothetical protein VM053_01550 [Gemmatimonadaceae bacterium]|nr:hypothetical protein [Gemmatimonadaceae bacterium]
MALQRLMSVCAIRALCASIPLMSLAGTASAQKKSAKRVAAAPPVFTRFDATKVGALKYRMIGPARGGRVTTVTGVPQQPTTFYMGSTGGGVWKTTDAGASWNNISDGYFASASMGSIDVADSDPNVIYAGTGSDAIRSNVSIGRGAYRSLDAGKTWTFIGLRDVGQIGSINIHPTNPDIVFAAAIGNPFVATNDRGVYRTRDAGRSWQKVLFVSDSTGAVDLEFQPGNPNVIYAVMWRAERKPWTIISGAREGGVYKSSDGGDTWSKLTNGLPRGLVGKADLAVSPAKPNRLYVLMEASPGGGLYRSDDGGASFAAIDTVTKGIITRPFYYTNLDADPGNADIVYSGTEGFYRSTDGGKSWTTVDTPHGDNHDLWINPRNSSIMIQSNDGGANVTLDGGRTWSTQYNQPTAEIYQIYVDDQFPYRVYGAQQDNTTLILPSLPPSSGSPDDPIQTWRSGPGCETGPIIPHISHPDTVYASCKGQFSRMSLTTGQEKQYWVGSQSLYGNPGKDLIYRFQRVSPMEVSPHDSRVVYYGSQFLHRTRDEGVTWEKMSPDLTWNLAVRQQKASGEPITIDVTGEETYSTLYAIRESPLKAGVIWTGSNDGPFHVTRDNGVSWKNVTPENQPRGCRVQNIEPSPHRVASAYYAVLCYQLGDFRPYIWETDDYGESWKLLTNGSNGIPIDFPTRVVREDPTRPGLLYAGTEFGAFISFDNGAKWHSFQLNLPVTPITDMKIHRGDLALSTQGRAFWILDDLAPIRQMTDALVSGGAHLLTPRDAYRLRYNPGFGGAESNRESSSDPQYLPAGAVIDYWLPSNPSSVSIDIIAPDGRVIRTMSSEPFKLGDRPPPALNAQEGAALLPKNPGLNRFVWNFEYVGPYSANPRQSGRNGPLAAPGKYTVTMVSGGKSESRRFNILPDPRVERDGVTTDVLNQQLAFNLKVRDLVSDANGFANALAVFKKDASSDRRQRVAEIERVFVTPPIRYSKPGLQSHIQYLYSETIGADQKVGRDALDRYRVLRAELDALTERLKAIQR